jgi:hypothetical protein
MLDPIVTIRHSVITKPKYFRLSWEVDKSYAPEILCFMTRRQYTQKAMQEYSHIIYLHLVPNIVPKTIAISSIQ